METGTLVGGRFEIEHIAGKGGMGTVFRARDRLTTEAIALKVVDGWHANARFEREAALLAQLSDERIVRYVSHGDLDDGRMYLAMEWLEGRPLDVVLSDAMSPLSIADCIEIGRRIAGALAAAHQLGVVHRDVKPSNVILRGGRSADAMLVDFGIARATSMSSSSSNAMTATGAVLGTPAYMAPEQARGERSVDRRADIFSLGCVLFECLCGRPAFIGEHVIAVLAKILLEPAPRARSLRPEISGALDRLIAATLEKDPQARPQSAEAIVKQLEAIARGDVALLAREPSGSVMRRQPAAMLGVSERRLVTVLLARLHPERAPQDESADEDEDGALLAGITHEAAARDHAATAFGITLTPLADGTILGAVVAENAGPDTAERVARCALSIRATTPNATIALATGRAIVDYGGDLPVGDAIDRAANLFAAHQRDGVWMDEATASIIGSRFELLRVDAGVKLIGERSASDRIRTVMGRVVPFVGRDRELGLLEATFDECASEPVGRALLVVADSGIGKSRLHRELVARLSRRANAAKPTVWLAHADPLIRNEPYALARDVLRCALGIDAGDSLEARGEKLIAHTRGMLASEVARCLGAILDVPINEPITDEPIMDNDALSSSSAAAKREGARAAHVAVARTAISDTVIADAFISFASAELERSPLLIVLDDVHHADLNSLELFGRLLAHARQMPLLLFALARPMVDESHPRLWEELRCQRILLEPLLRKASATMARAILGERPEIDAIVQRAAGNALFVEELTRACWLQNCSARSCACNTDVLDDLPPTVAAATEARLSSLSASARHVLRAASVFGHRFWRGAVAHLVGEAARGTLDDELRRLESTELLVRAKPSRFVNETEYVFGHSLLRDAAYAMLTDADRGLGHSLAAEWLEQIGADASLIAHHRDASVRRKAVVQNAPSDV